MICFPSSGLFLRRPLREYRLVHDRLRLVRAVRRDFLGIGRRYAELVRTSPVNRPHLWAYYLQWPSLNFRRFVLPHWKRTYVLNTASGSLFFLSVVENLAYLLILDILAFSRYKDQCATVRESRTKNSA